MTFSFPSILIFLAILWVLAAGIVTFNLVNWRKTTQQAQLKAEKRRSEQLGLLEETGRIIADSFDEKEILQRAVQAIIQRFGYAEAAVCLLTPDDMLEIAVISGTSHVGYEVGYQQKIGTGIIGHTAEIQKTYVSNNVGQDPYYFSTFDYNGSVICTPIWKQDKLFGVLYVETNESNAFDELDIKTLEVLANQISSALQRAALYNETQEKLHILSTLQNISKTISSSLDIEVIGKSVVLGLKESFGYTHVSIYLLKEDYLHLLTEIGYPEEMVIRKIHISQGVSGRAIRTKSAQFIQNTTKEDIFLKADHKIVSEICIPLIKEDIAIGTLNIEANELNKLNQTDVNLLTTIAGPIAIAVDNARLHAEIKKLATTDAVTGLSNRHVFEEMLSAEVERAQRLGMNVSLIIFDIDSFKEYNDTYGHPAGDARLKSVANIIKNNLRKYDVAARYGGDEFAIILSNTNEEKALAFATRLHEAAQQGSLENDKAGYTLSMGIATLPQDATTPTELLIAADNAALRAKFLGKNRILLAREMN